SSATGQNSCTSNFDSSQASNATYQTLMLPELQVQAALCATAFVGLANAGFVHATAPEKARCYTASAILYGGPPKSPIAKIPPAKATAAERKAIDTQNDQAANAHVAAMATYLGVVALRLDRYCSPLLATALALQNSPQPVLYTASRPTLYVLMASGGAAPAASSQSGNSSGSKSSGGATAGSAMSAAVDNPDALLLYMIAQRLQSSVCTIAATTPHKPGTIPAPYDNDNVPGIVAQTSSPCAYKEDNGKPTATDAVPALAVVPESEWTIEDFRAQCAEDPYVAVPGAGHGTVAGIILNGAITSRDGAFRLFTIAGGTEADFGAELVTCEAPQNSQSPPNNVAEWSDLISSGTTTHRLSMFPIAAAGAIMAANLTAKSSYNVSPTVSGTAASNALTAFEKTNTSLAVGQGLGQFAAGFSTLTFGNPGSALTLRPTFEKWASEFNQHFVAFCLAQGKVAPNVCAYIK